MAFAADVQVVFVARWVEPDFVYNERALNPDEGGDMEMGDDDALEQESREYYEVLLAMLADGCKDSVKAL